MLNIIFAILVISTTPSFDVRTLDGQTLSGPLVELSADRLVLGTKEGNVSLNTTDVLTLAPQHKPKPAKLRSADVVELVDGSVIHARRYVAHGPQAQLTLAGGETVEAPAAAVRTVRLNTAPQSHSTPESDPLAAEWSRLTKMKTVGDLLVIRGAANLDYHEGVLHDITDEVVQFELDGELLPIERAKVFGFVYRRATEMSLPAAVCRIADSAGSMWSAQSLSLADELQWTTPAGLSVAEPLGNITGIDFSSGKLVYLSDLQPERAVWTPYFGQNPLSATKRFHAPRFDRGFQSDPLRLADVVYDRGLAIYCRTELVYRLPERFSRFQATVGIDDAVRPNGKVRLVVRGDDRLLLDVVVLGSDAPRTIDLDIKDVRRLTILADFDGGLSAGDRLLLCNARVIK